MEMALPAVAVSRPAASVIMPVYNGARFLERSIGSVRAQTFADWELLAVDDGSTDSSHAQLCRHAAADSRIRVIRLARNQGLSAARNAALAQATGQTVAYLDCDDEYFPDHLGHVHAWHGQADVLVFAYEIMERHTGPAGTLQIRTYDPGPVRGWLMEVCIAVPLAVAHRRSLLERTGLFNAEAGNLFDEDKDMWQRLARAGAEFLFLPLKCGRYYHIHPNSLSHMRWRRRTHGETFAAVGGAATLWRPS